MRVLRLCLVFALVAMVFASSETVDAFKKGESFYSEKKFAIAQDFLVQAVKENPLNDKAYFYLANVYTVSSNYAEADKNYQKAIDLKPANADYYFNYASLKFLQKMPDVSEQLYAKAAGLRPDYFEVHLRLAKLYFDTYEWNKSADSLEKVLSLKPDHPDRTTIENLIKKLRGSLAYAEQKKKELAGGGKPADGALPFTVDLKDAGKIKELGTKSEESVKSKPTDPDIVE